MAGLFGTDGVRGVAGVDLTADLARSIAGAAVAELATGRSSPLVVVGRDPRPSGAWLQEAVVDGLKSAGADVALLGVIPTPAVARAVVEGVRGRDSLPAFGVVISASHNPVRDNGIKLFGPGGVKLDEAVEERIEGRLASLHESGRRGVVVADLTGDHEWYVEALLATLSTRLDGLRLVVDCANGAAGRIAADTYSRAGANVTVINTDPTGAHINEGCGATHLEALQAAVVNAGADMGIAHDGDADRCLAVSAEGEPIDGDAILAILALHAHARGNLRRDLVVATVMSNLGLQRLLAANGISLAITPVGDRHVAERMRVEGAVVGGEQSGHVLLLDHATTGDGLLTGLHLAAAVVAAGRPISALAGALQRLPQVLVNVTTTAPVPAIAAAQEVIDLVAAELGDGGRVLVRPSGTEPLVRVMVEAETAAQATELAQRIVAALRDGAER
ncbi:MAG TPA: phosphoglucosamine mutase [Mycobacteriales bacterium]|nr:phosphoglucosamine mutase [Mycobacteriales bacterium]